MVKGETVMPVPQGIISTTTGPVDPTAQEKPNANDNQTVEETTQESVTEEVTATEQAVVEGSSNTETKVAPKKRASKI
jgi:hypothetical protein